MLQGCLCQQFLSSHSETLEFSANRTLSFDYNLNGFKGYLPYKTIFCNKVAFDVQFMIFLFEEKMFHFWNI